MAEKRSTSKKKSDPVSNGLVKKASEMIRRMLFMNEISPGQKIHYRDLAEDLGISPTPVIHALKWLEFQGVVRQEANRGFYLEQISLDEVNEIYYLREILEVSLLPSVLENLDASAIKRLTTASDKYNATIKDGYRRQTLLAAMDFHQTLAVIAKGKIAQQLLRNLYDRLYLKCKVDILFSRQIERKKDYHKKILENLVAGDLDGATRILREDIRSVREHVVDSIAMSLIEKQEIVF